MAAGPATDAGRASETAAIQLTGETAVALFAHGQTTQRTIEAAQQVARSLGFEAALHVRWGEVIVGIGSSRDVIFAAEPLGVEMRRVVTTLSIVDQLRGGSITPAAAATAIRAVDRIPPLSVTHFAIMAAAGAAALGVVFGARDLFVLLVIALSAGTGAYLRRWLAAKSHNPLIQPFGAALLAGVVGALALRFGPDDPQRLVAVCPCMVLVPGPHILNGALDLARMRIPLGVSRMVYAGLIIVMICAGLLLGLSFGNISIPVLAPATPVPLMWDVLAAGVAVAAYGTFFAMPTRMLPLPVVVGMLAHGARWAALAMGANVEIAAFLACFIVGIIITPLAERMRVPFAAVAFAAVVALIPGVFIFHMAEGMTRLVSLGTAAPPGLPVAILADGATAFLITLSMAFGLLIPKLAIDHFARR
jgi:uncharacterized membrane protein YjjP (DUF1212 family)